MSAAPPDSASSPVGLYLVALAGERARLEATLATLAGQCGGLTPVLLAAPDDALRDLAEREAMTYLPSLPSQLASECYWAEVLAALATVASDKRDWLVLRAGTRLPAQAVGRWLALAPRRAPAACFPLSLRHPCTSAFPDNRGVPALAVQAIDDWLNQFAPGRCFDLPVLAGYSALLREPRPVPTGAAASGDDAVAAALRHDGWSLVACDGLYIDDRDLPSLDLPAGLYEDWQDACLRRHPLSAARHALGQLAARGEAPPAAMPAARPVCLHLLHSWGGGLEKWVREFAAADATQHHLFLRPIGDWAAFGQGLMLSAGRPDAEPLRRWTLARSILSTAQVHEEYAALLEDIIADFQVSTVVVSSLIGHALDALRTGLPTIWLAHDFYPLCPPLVATFEEPCESCTPERMSRCLASNPEHRFFRHEPFAHWLSLKEAFVACVLAEQPLAVVPSPSVAGRLQRLAPALAAVDFHVIPHGLAAATAGRLTSLRELPPPAPPAGAPLRIVIPGLLQPQKGLALLEAVMPALLERAEVLLLGAGPGGRRFVGMPGVQVVQGYTADSFGEELAAFRPELGLLLSTVPESFSYTLSELWAAGLPVAATRLGAFADRIADGERGWLFDPAPAALLALLDCLRDDRACLARVRARLLEEAPRTAPAMVDAYAALVAARRSHPLPAVRPRWLLPSAADGASTAPAADFDPTQPYGRVARAFLQYTLRKARLSPRLPAPVKRLLWLGRRR